MRIVADLVPGALVDAEPGAADALLALERAAPPAAVPRPSPPSCTSLGRTRRPDVAVTPTAADEPQPAAGPARPAVRTAGRRRRLHRPARRHGRLLRSRRAARAGPSCAGTPVIVGGGGRAAWCCPRPTRPGAFGVHSRDADDPGPPAVPAGHRGRAQPRRATPQVVRRRHGDLPVGHPAGRAAVARRGVPRRRRARSAGSAGPREIGELIRARVADEQGITCSVGVATHQVRGQARLAPAASPTACSSCPADGVVAFLHPLPVGALWGVGEKTEEVLTRLGLHTVGDLAHTPRRHPAARARARPPARTCTRWPGAATSAGGRRTSRTRASAPRRRSPATSTTPTSSAASCCGCPSGRPPGCARPARSAAPSASRSGSPTSPRSPGPGPCREPTDVGREVYATARAALRGARAGPGPAPAGRRPGRGPGRGRARAAPAAARRAGPGLARGRAGGRPGRPTVRRRDRAPGQPGRSGPVHRVTRMNGFAVRVSSRPLGRISFPLTAEEAVEQF